MITFEEQFPELKDKVLEHLDEGERDWNRFQISVGDVQEHCLSKQRVREAIQKHQWVEHEEDGDVYYIKVKDLLKELEN